MHYCIYLILLLLHSRFRAAVFAQLKAEVINPSLLRSYYTWTSGYSPKDGKLSIMKLAKSLEKNSANLSLTMSLRVVKSKIRLIGPYY